ncbi:MULTISPECIES: hypothetical protein [unclassified Streptomyces]|uniref:hypothetical protein n=1 Tax=unclassified Streptomyces TaxID=2593676 RepID=UPI002DDB7BD0|nr:MULTISPECIES: hypothetical protein [unclassified Streptomyces]WSA96284.1 hypothetical protein OIE63_35560 [Streptomyces sp. NBC_01795]WSB80698.1 hypothetical protein OHB04_36670 [Streptomyces sp. NBC_01775]WSS11093.1 hypothetical protein OG533_03580 [Streptomyces sp. NBC_01186]WSS39801.1 hypothetical protein OG220_03675 [Streptomyces sp. NBC_01187]
MAGFDDSSKTDAASDFSPGAQVPLSGASGQTAATQALASAAYRDDEVEKLIEANPEASFKKPKISLFEPNLGEAFARAVQTRLLGGARAPLIQSFGIEPQSVVEHCLAATRVRKQRDSRLTVVMSLFGLVFLPGVLLWLGAFQLRRVIAGSKDKRAGAFGTVALVAVGALIVLFAIRLPFGGLWALYLRAMLVAPVVGWLWAKQICERYAKDLRSRWESLLGGAGVGAKIPEAVPQDPSDAGAERIRLGLAKVAAEQASNLVYYAGPKGILGMGTRWGSWQLAEELVPAEGHEDINPFRSWDVVRAIHDQLRMLERGPLHTGGFPAPSIRHWVVSPVAEGAKAVKRPDGQEVEGYRIKDFEIQRICNEQQFGAGNRHYLGTQFVLWDGQLVITLLITVTVLHHTLRIEVTGHALGPVHGLFTSGPKAKTKQVSKSVKFWETRTVKLPLVEAKEVVRLSVRAPFTWFPPVLDFLGGKLALPEPFGLRHAWADKPWRHRFMADDALRAATPVLRVVHSAAIRVLAENGCDVEKFGSRSLNLSAAVQDPKPFKADAYDA